MFSHVQNYVNLGFPHISPFKQAYYYNVAGWDLFPGVSIFCCFGSRSTCNLQLSHVIYPLFFLCSLHNIEAQCHAFYQLTSIFDLNRVVFEVYVGHSIYLFFIFKQNDLTKILEAFSQQSAIILSTARAYQNGQTHHAR